MTLFLIMLVLGCLWTTLVVILNPKPPTSRLARWLAFQGVLK